MTPSGGWIPAVIAGHTGVGLSQRAQSFVTRAEDGPYNVIEPGKKPRVTLTPTLAMKESKPYLAFAVQGGDSQDQNLLQWFLDIVEFGMTPQQAAEAHNINSYQMRSSFGEHESEPGHMLVASATPDSVKSGAAADGVYAGVRGADLGADQWDSVRPAPWHDVGWLEQSWGGLRDRVVRIGEGRRETVTLSAAKGPRPLRLSRKSFSWLAFALSSRAAALWRRSA